MSLKTLYYKRYTRQICTGSKFLFSCIAPQAPFPFAVWAANFGSTALIPSPPGQTDGLLAWS